MREQTSSRPQSACLKRFVKSFLTAYALCTAFHAPLTRAGYDTFIDYAIASIYELLGEYDLKFLLFLILAAVCYGYGDRRRENGASHSFLILAGFFSLCLLLGQSYFQAGNSSLLRGSWVNLLKAALTFAGYTALFHTLIGLAAQALDSHTFQSDRRHFFSDHAFLKSFLILLGVYLPILVLAYPGNLCWDAIGQIDQVVSGTGYSTHHPLFHTLIMGGFVKAGQKFLRSPDMGLFCYMLFQNTLLAAALAATIEVLNRRKARFGVLVCTLLLYCLTPAYSNLASTALKDVPYSAFVILYVVWLALLLEKPERLKNRRFVISFFLIQLGVILFRNNGLYVILLSGIASFLFLFPKYGPRERVRGLLTSFGGSILTARLLLAFLSFACNAVPGSMGEMLSLPFQQTARYLQFYQHELDADERAAIEAVLGDPGALAACYDPATADPVKARFNKNAPPRQLAGYMKAWIKGFFKHPGTYFEAFFLHVYGWFTPAVSNSIRYETDGYDLIRKGGLFPNAEKLLIFYYRFAGRTLLGFLENTGAAVWALFFLTLYQKKHGQKHSVCAGAPLWISLLICMASPCFFGHPRYALPILSALPFLYGFTLTSAPSRPAQK